MNQSEFEALLADTTKLISGDIFWSEDKKHPPAVEFRIEVTCQIGYTLFIKGCASTFSTGAFLMDTTGETLAKKIGELFTCSPLDQYIRIRTPFLYPDNDLIDLYYKEVGEDIVLTDLGETLSWFKMQTVALEIPPELLQLINDICLDHGIEFSRGMLLLRLKQSDDLAEGIMLLSQAILKVLDIGTAFKDNVGESAVDEVEELLQERQISFERNPEFTGKSGRVWRPDFRIRHPRHNSLIYILSTGSRSRAQEEADRTLAAWHDLSNWKAGPEALRFISLFDDTLDVWTEEDFRLVEDVSEVTYLSRPDEFLDKLAS